MVFVTRKTHFNAAHRLNNPQKSVEWNQETYGKCNYEHWHGHNYELFVTVAGTPNPETGYVADLGKLKTIVEDVIISKCDHRNLNLDVDFLQGVIPSAENLAIQFFKQLEAPINAICGENAKLYSVRVAETERNVAEYRPNP